MQFLMVMTNAVEGTDEEFNAWYDGRHVADVLALDGFVAAQRFVFTPTEGNPTAPYKYLAMYIVADGDIERAERALRASREAARRAAAEGTESPMPISATLSGERATWWFTSLGEQVTAESLQAAANGA
ncbi:MAG: hypothetical protein EPO13_11775 [Actinomycetota bacterium]|nr:MAG: hypothetical protein EPO13_11775 [Actinomycetota bacterium]